MGRGWVPRPFAVLDFSLHDANFMISIYRQFLVALLIAALGFPAVSECKAISVSPATVTYDYDAFGILLHSTGATPNNYLFAGEQFDPDLGLYYNRARYLNVSTGRFWSMDTDEGESKEPSSLHRYLYAGGDPVNATDPSGHDFDLGSLATAAASISTLATQAIISLQVVVGTVYLNLYRAPEILTTAGQALTVASGVLHGAILIVPGIENLIKDMQYKLANYRGTYSSSPSQMGLQVEDVCGGNLQPGTRGVDRIDVLDGQPVLTQIQGTTAKDPDAIFSRIQQGVNKLNGVTGRQVFTYKDGSTIKVDATNAPKVLMQAIPEDTNLEGFNGLIQKVEQLEQTSGVIIEMEEGAGLD